MTTYQATPIDEIPRIRDGLFNAYAAGKTKDVKFRREQLLQLAYMFQDNKERIYNALHADLARPKNETEFLEYMSILDQALLAYENVDKWAKPEVPARTLNTFPMRPRILKEPKGVVLIIGPFNYPLFCIFIPMIGAIAAGCAVAVKPSEMAPATAALFTELLPKYLDETLYTVVNGAIPETTALLDQQWDHIFFTGGGRVGKVVATAAAKHLTSATLELGGKNPTIVDKDCDFDASARRILWAKSANAGQSCTAPDYIMVVGREAHDKLITALQKAYKQFFPNPEPQAEEMSHVINGGAFQRLTGLLAQTKGTVLLGGRSDASKNWIATTVVDGCTYDDSLMQAELFGPVLPIVTVASIEEAVAHVGKGEHPLGCYIFSKNQKIIDYVFANTTSGTVLANEAVIQPGIRGIPFGGIGASGYGHSNGKFSFDTFTHLRGSLQVPSWLEKMMTFRYPPHTPQKLALMKNVVRTIPYTRPGTKSGYPYTWGKLVAALAGVVGLVVAFQARRR